MKGCPKLKKIYSNDTGSRDNVSSKVLCGMLEAEGRAGEDLVQNG